MKKRIEVTKEEKNLLSGITTEDLTGPCKVTREQYDRTVMVGIEGSINVTNIEQSFADISKIVEEICRRDAPNNMPIFNISKLKYISPTGIRMLNSIREIYGYIVLFYASKNVYEILNACGFTEIVKVVPAPLDITEVPTIPDFGESGTSADIKILDEERVFKVFRETYADYRRQHPAVYEYMNGVNSFKLGVPCAIPLELIHYKDQYGIIQERLDKQFAKYMWSDLDKIEERVKEMARFSRNVCRIPVDVYTTELPDHRSIYEEIVRHVKNLKIKQTVIGPTELEMIKDIIYNVPPTPSYVHGDAFFDNIMFDRLGKMRYIDFSYSGYGHPMWDMLTMYMLFCEGGKGNFIVRDTSPKYNKMPLKGQDLKDLWRVYAKEFTEDWNDATIDQLEEDLGALVACINLIPYSMFAGYAPDPEESLEKNFRLCLNDIVDYYKKGLHRPVF